MNFWGRKYLPQHLTELFNVRKASQMNTSLYQNIDLLKRQILGFTDGHENCASVNPIFYIEN